MNIVPTLSSKMLARSGGGLQDRVVRQSMAGILLGLWFLLKTKFQVGTELGLECLQDQRLREVAMLPPGSYAQEWPLPTNQDKDSSSVARAGNALVVEFLVTFTEAKWTVSRQKKDVVQGTKRLHAICCPAWERRNTQAWISLLGEKLLRHEEAAEK